MRAIVDATTESTNHVMTNMSARKRWKLLGKLYFSVKKMGGN